MERNSIVCYNSVMSNILIAGKDLPDCLSLAEGFSSTGRQVFAACKNNAEIPAFDSQNIFFTQWNRGSEVSSRSFLIQAETKIHDINEYLIYFDAANYGPQFELDKASDLSFAIDTMINSYLYFTTELLARLEQRRDNAVIVFLLKSLPSKYDLTKAGNKNSHPTSRIVSTAQNAFRTIAENIATSVGEKEYLSVILAEYDENNEFFKNDKACSLWLANCLDCLENQKNKQTQKQAIQWNKAGSKLKSGFGFF